MKPNDMPLGLVYDLPIEIYHGDARSVSKSGLDDIARCPAVYHAWHLDPDRPPETEKAGQLEGNLAHCALLEPDQFAQRFVSVPKDAPKRPTEAQWNAAKPSQSSADAMAWWTEFNKQSAGKRVISGDQRYVAMCQAESMRNLRNVFGSMSLKDMLKTGKTEVSAYWIDPLTGVRCRCRPDLAVQINSSQAVLVDVKTYSDAGQREFGRQVARKRYHVQDSFYSQGYAAASGLEVVAFIFVVVETQWPFLAASYRLGEESRHEGELQFRDQLDIYAECLRTNTWPGYTPSTEVFDLPAYALTPQEVEISYV